MPDDDLSRGQTTEQRQVMSGAQVGARDYNSGYPGHPPVTALGQTPAERAVDIAGPALGPDHPWFAPEP